MPYTDPAQEIKALKDELKAAKASEKAAIERAQVQYREMRVSIRTAEKLELELLRQAAEAKGKAGRQADALLYFKWRLEETERALAAKSDASDALEKAKATNVVLFRSLEEERAKSAKTVEFARKTSASWEKLRNENEQLRNKNERLRNENEQLKQQIAWLRGQTPTALVPPQKRKATLAENGDPREDMGPPRKYRRLEDGTSPQQRKLTKQQQTSMLNGRSPYAYDPAASVPARSPSSTSSPCAQRPSPLSTARSRAVTTPSHSPSTAPRANKPDPSKAAAASPPSPTHTPAILQAATGQESADVFPAERDGRVTASSTPGAAKGDSE